MPDVHMALGCLLGGRRDAGEGLFPPLLRSAPECLQRTAHLRELYAALAESSGGAL